MLVNTCGVQLTCDAQQRVAVPLDATNAGKAQARPDLKLSSHSQTRRVQSCDSMQW